MKPRRHNPSTSTRAFTLTEMIVAIGVVSLLTVGVGQIFRSVSSLVSTGAGVIQADQMARTLERQLRQDFADLSRLPAEETFLVIRNRRAGDLDNNGVLDTNDGEVALYRTPADREIDQNRGIDPYQRDSDDNPISSAVTVRLDDMMFLARSDLGYESYQQDIDRNTTSQYALLYYGHGMRPPLDEVDLNRADTDAPRRLNFPDGDFGAAFGDDNRFEQPGFEQATGRNAHAGDFVLCRRPILLLPAEAAGYWPADPRRTSSLIGADGEFAASPIDWFSAEAWRPGPLGGAAFATDDPDAFPYGARGADGVQSDRGYGSDQKRPNPRLLRHGRTDVVAMGVDSDAAVATHLRSWLQGEQSYFANGVNLFAPIDSPLWGNGGPLTGGSAANYVENLRRQQTALAAMIHRPLVETEPPSFRPSPDLTKYVPSTENQFDARMDLHAVLAEHCSSFEIAWSDGTRWQHRDILEWDLDGDGVNEREIKEGDLVWFDMDFTFFDFWQEGAGRSGLGSVDFLTMYPRPNPDPECGGKTFSGGKTRRFTTLPGDPSNQNGVNVDRARSINGALELATGDAVPLNNFAPYYSLRASHAVANDNNTGFDELEYLAIFGFQTPEGYDQGETIRSTGGYMSPWPKPKLVRIRYTLHDAQHRLTNGKTYEVILRLANQ